MEIKREDIVKNILAKGCRPDSRTNLNRDHDYYFLQHKGKESHLFVKISRSREYREYREPVLKRQARNWGITFRDLVKYFDCTSEYQDLIKILIRSGKLDP